LPGALHKQTGKPIQPNHNDRIGEQGNSSDFMYNHTTSNKGHLVTSEFEAPGTPGMVQQAGFDKILNPADGRPQVSLITISSDGFT
jgi:hypothetical protein